MKLVFKIFILLTAVCIGSCKKYEDGPDYSLSTKKARLANKWKVESYYVNGVDYTSNYRVSIISETLEIFKSGSYQYSEVSNWNWSSPYIHGTWNLIHNKEDFEMIPDNPSNPYKLYKILKLESTSLWLEHVVNATLTEEFHYVQQLDAP